MEGLEGDAGSGGDDAALPPWLGQEELDVAQLMALQASLYTQDDVGKFAGDLNLDPQDDVGKFAGDLNLDPQAVSFLRELPMDLRQQVIANFDPSGTKDGNVLGRLQAYVKHILRRNGLPPMEQLNGAASQQHIAQDIPSAAAQLASAMSETEQLALMTMTPERASVASEAVWRFVEQLGLSDTTSEFLGRLPEDLQASVIRGFNPSGTKDGNVWGRLLGYVRSLWSRRLALIEPATTFIRSLPEEVQVAVILDFDAGGSKDGNVSARLEQFANYLIARSGGMHQSNAASAAPTAQPDPMVQQLQELEQWQQQQLEQIQQAQQQQIWQAAAQPQPQIQATTMSEFAMALNLDPGNTLFLQSLPEDLQTTVISIFDPSGTKDGNIWGRLFAFVRRMCVKYASIDKASFEQMKTMQEEDQKRLLSEWTATKAAGAVAPQLHSAAQAAVAAAAAAMTQWDIGPDAGAAAAVPAIERFAQLWGLDARAVQFLHGLPEAVRDHVLAGFDGSGTKDGNVFGRLLGFARHTWARALGLDQQSVAFIKTLPEEAQMICLTDFDPSGTKDGNVAGRLQGFAKKALAQASVRSQQHNHHQANGYSCVQPMFVAPNYQQQQVEVAAPDPNEPPKISPLSADPLVAGFLERCNLDWTALSYLETLPEDVLTRVLNEFDPSGTKDGNVLGRLQGYVRMLNARRKRPHDDSGAYDAKRSRYGAA